MSDLEIDCNQSLNGTAFSLEINRPLSTKEIKTLAAFIKSHALNDIKLALGINLKDSDAYSALAQAIKEKEGLDSLMFKLTSTGNRVIDSVSISIKNMIIDRMLTAIGEMVKNPSLIDLGLDLTTSGSLELNKQQSKKLADVLTNSPISNLQLAILPKADAHFLPTHLKQVVITYSYEGMFNGLEQLTQLEKLELHWLNESVFDRQKLINTMVTNAETLTSFNIGLNYWLEDSDYNALLGAIAQCTHLKELSLSYLRNGEQAEKTLYSLISNNRYPLEALTINEFYSDSDTGFFNALKTNTIIKKLSLSGHGYDYTELQVVLLALKNNTSIEQLTLSYSEVMSEDDKAKFETELNKILERNKRAHEDAQEKTSRLGMFSRNADASLSIKNNNRPSMLH